MEKIFEIMGKCLVNGIRELDDEQLFLFGCLIAVDDEYILNVDWSRLIDDEMNRRMEQYMSK